MKLIIIKIEQVKISTSITCTCGHTFKEEIRPGNDSATCPMCDEVIPSELLESTFIKLLNVVSEGSSYES